MKYNVFIKTREVAPEEFKVLCRICGKDVEGTQFTTKWGRNTLAPYRRGLRHVIEAHPERAEAASVALAEIS